jgi:hypothetical protein
MLLVETIMMVATISRLEHFGVECIQRSVGSTHVVSKRGCLVAGLAYGY